MIDHLINYTSEVSLKYQYQKANPFPHIALDNFIKNENLIQNIIQEFQNYNEWGYDGSKYSEKHQIKKYFSPWCPSNLEQLPKATKFIINFFNSQEFINFVEEISGIKNLEPDHSLSGAGMHRIDRDGKLSVHLDCNKHPEKDLYRRINLLLYLNENWKPEWGGDLELWNSDASELMKTISPIINRLVIFNTTSNSYHGHPKPLKCPENRSRYSIAIYYFSKEYPENEKTNITSAVWKETT